MQIVEVQTKKVKCKNKVMTRKRVAGAIGALVSKKGQQLTVCKSVTQNFADSDVIKSCYGIGGDREVYKL